MVLRVPKCQTKLYGWYTMRFQLMCVRVARFSLSLLPRYLTSIQFYSRQNMHRYVIAVLCFYCLLRRSIFVLAPVYNIIRIHKWFSVTVGAISARILPLLCVVLCLSVLFARSSRLRILSMCCDWCQWTRSIYVRACTRTRTHRRTINRCGKRVQVATWLISS